MKRNYRNLHTQKGLSLIILVLILIITGTAIYISQLNANNIRAMRATITANALSEAKNALLGYAVTVDLQGSCTATCARPGDLPCPDTNNDGEAEPSCGNPSGTTGQTSRLGRLPWKTLGLNDLRDGNGDRLWYAVSNNFKNNFKALPLNNDTLGTIHITDPDALTIADATGTTGAIAIILSPGEPLTRQDGTEQVRSDANTNNPVHFLDNFGEDNASFADSTANGFIKGVIRNATGDVILNDQLIEITKNDFFSAVDAKVLKEVKAALLSYYGTNLYYPKPAAFNNVNCLGTTIGITCGASLLLTEGRIPATIVPAWGLNSILREANNGNWFQQNGWREYVYYAVAPACTLPLLCTSGAATLTLNGAINNETSNLVILLMSGPSISAQSRSNNGQKITESNYYEFENASISNNIYVRQLPHTTTFNDSVESVP
jgi:hypothetical protein